MQTLLLQLIWFFHPNLNLASIKGLSAGGNAYIPVCSVHAWGLEEETQQQMSLSQCTDFILLFPGRLVAMSLSVLSYRGSHISINQISICQAELNQIFMMWKKVLKRIVDKAIKIMFHL